MAEIDVLELMAWVRDEHIRRGSLDTNAQMRAMHDARRKAAVRVAKEQIQSDCIEMLKAGGFFESDDERQRHEAQRLQSAKAEDALQKRLNMARAGVVLAPDGKVADGGA